MALQVGLLFAVAPNIGHRLPIPFLRSASVRWSHMVETGSSDFAFGLMVGALLCPGRVRREEPGPGSADSNLP